MFVCLQFGIFLQLLNVVFTCLQLTIENMDLAEKLQASQESQKQLAKEVRLCLFLVWFAVMKVLLQFEDKCKLFLFVLLLCK